MIRFILLFSVGAVVLIACGGGGAKTTSPPPPPKKIVALEFFGFTAIACDHDDPFDGVAKTDYSDEVAAFTNLNQICPTGDVATTAARLVAGGAYAPLFYIEPVFFEFDNNGGRLSPNRDLLWDLMKQAITQSGVDPADIIFYLVDEPSLRGLDFTAIESAAATIKGDYPTAKLFLVEAYDVTRAPIIPASIDYWGFDAYTIRNPGRFSDYTDYLDQAAANLASHQALILIGDGNYTPVHAAAGLLESDMDEVAMNYYLLALERDDVAGLIVYTWAGGIDGPNEKGVRDMVPEVGAKWQEIGRAITGK